MAFYGMARFAARAARFVGRGLRRAPRPLYRPRRPRVVRRKKTANKVHSFVRWCDKDTTYGAAGPNTISETGSDQNLAYQFKLDNVVNPADFTNLYDSYKINKITLHIEPLFTSTNQYFNNLNIFSKKIRVVHDYNDANVLTQEDDYLEYSNCKSYSPTRTIKVTLYPKIQSGMLNTGGAVNAFASQASSKLWLNVDNDEVPHFGVKVFIPEDIASASEVLLFRVRARYHISLKNSK